jgi:hypothetical protein
MTNKVEKFFKKKEYSFFLNYWFVTLLVLVHRIAPRDSLEPPCVALWWWNSSMIGNKKEGKKKESLHLFIFEYF